jgi:hypothetical protein
MYHEQNSPIQVALALTKELEATTPKSKIHQNDVVRVRSLLSSDLNQMEVKIHQHQGNLCCENTPTLDFELR